MINQPAEPEFFTFDRRKHPEGLYWVGDPRDPFVARICHETEWAVYQTIGSDGESLAAGILIGPRIHQPSKLAEMERKAAAYDSLAAMIEHGPIDAAHFRAAGEGRK